MSAFYKLYKEGNRFKRTDDEIYEMVWKNTVFVALKERDKEAVQAGITALTQILEQKPDLQIFIDNFKAQVERM